MRSNVEQIQGFLADAINSKFGILAMTIIAFGGLISDAMATGYFFVVCAGSILMLYALYKEWDRRDLYSQSAVSIPVVFNISNPADCRSALNALYGKLEQEYPDHRESLKRYFNITDEDLIYHYNGDIYDERRMIDFLKICKHDLKRLDARTPGNVHFHIAYIGPISGAILVGTLFPTEGVTLYQYDRSNKSYSIALQIDGRNYKEPVRRFEVLEGSLSQTLETIGGCPGKRVTLALELSSHKIDLAELDEPRILLKSSLGATLDNADEFIRANREIYTVINELQTRCDKITLVYSIPTALGLLLGMSLQTYWNIRLTQYDKGRYRTVIESLREIEYRF